MSRVHAKVFGGHPVRIEDAQSSNGIRVRGARIEAGVPTAVNAGDLIEIGPAVLVIQESPAVATAAAAVHGPAPQNDAYMRLMTTVAKSALSVLLLGETGSGKTNAAAAIHRESPRASKPFIHLNCAAFPESLLEAELFGYERGAFTGAVGAKPGLIEGADGGTLFLDEIGEMPPTTQAKLLGVIESRNVLRLGSVRPKHIDVRFLAATNRDLLAQIETGNFRRDLYFRLNGISIPIPPLRDRRNEIIGLAERFLDDLKTQGKARPLELSSEARAVLLSYSWPGNIRELRNVIERAAVFATSHLITPEDLAIHEGAAGEGPRSVAPLAGALSALERERIIQALDETSGNQTHAARALGISRRALISRIEQYGLPRPRKK